MNFSTSARRMALAGLTLVCLTIAQSAFAQCGDFQLAPPSPVIVNLNLTQMNGTKARLDNSGMTALGFDIGGTCFYEVTTDATLVGGWTTLPYFFDCTQLGLNTLYVRVNGPAGPSTLNGHSRELDITIHDGIIPLIDAPADPAPDAADFAQCYSTTVPGTAMTLLAWPMAPPTVVAVGEYADNCLANLTYSILNADATISTGSGNVPSNYPFQVGTSTVTYKVADGSGNQASDFFTVVVQDAEPPAISCPTPLVSYDTDNGFCSTTLSFAATATDNCVLPVNAVTWQITNPNLSMNSGTGSISNYAFALGSSTVQFTVTDGASLTAMCNYIVNVADNENPTYLTVPYGSIAGPNPVTYYTSNDVNPVSLCDYKATWTNPTFSDNCTGMQTLTVDYSDDANPPAVVAQGASEMHTFDLAFNTTTVTYEATDANGNTSTYSFAVTVIDNQVPVLSFAFKGSLDSTDTNPANIYTQNVDPGTCGATITIERPSQSILDPVFCSPSPTPCSNYSFTDCGTVYGPFQGPAYINGFPTDMPPVAPNPTFLNSAPALNTMDPVNRFATLTFPVGRTVIPYWFVDSDGNDTTIFVIVEVKENEPPAANCIGTTYLLPLDAAGMATLNPVALNNGSSDNCGAIVFTTDHPTPYTCADKGLHTVTLTVEDLSGNFATCTATVRVADNIVPTLTCPANAVVPMGPACTGTPTGIAMTLGNPTDAGHYNDNCSFGPNPIAYKIDGGVFINGNDAAVAGALTAGLHTITYRVTDNAILSNIAVCNFTVNVKDLTGPTFTGCPPSVTINYGAGSCVAQASWTAPTAADACSGLAPGYPISSHTSPGLFNFGSTPVTYTALDNAGNVSTCVFNVVVVDNQPPALVCKPSITVDLNANTPAQPTQVTVNATDIISSVSDNSCFYTFSNTSRVYSCGNVGVASNYALTVTDNNMNASTCVTTVIVRDVTPPVASCATISGGTNIINLNAAGTVTVFANDGTAVLPNISLNNASTDNCGIVTYEVSKDGINFAPSISLSCADISGPKTLTLRVTDKAPVGAPVTGTANSSVCTKIVTIKDVTPPGALVFAPGTQTVTLSSCSASTLPADIGIPTATDVCTGALTFANGGITLLSETNSLGVCPIKNVITRTWKATDGSGNTTTAIQTITIQDIAAPTWLGAFSTPQAVQLLHNALSPNCIETFVPSSSSPVSVGAANVSDNCTAAGNITFKYSVDYEPLGNSNPNQYGLFDATLVSGNVVSQFPIGVTVVTFYAFDECNNSKSTTVTVTVLDKAKPTINEPFAQTLGNTDNVCDQVFTLDNVTNNCGNTFTWFRPLAAASDFTDCSLFLNNGNGGVTETFTTPPGQGSISVPAFNYNSAANAHPTAFFPVGNTIVKYTATDAAGNTATCSFTVKVIDVQAPVPTCPPNQILPTTCATDLLPDYRNLVSISDNCNSTVLKTQEAPNAPGVLLSTIFGPTPIAGQMATITMKATDQFANNLFGTCTFKITLADGEAPVPVEASLRDTISFCGGVTLTAPKANDPCNPNPTIYGTPSSPVGMLIPGSNPPMYNFIYTPAFGNPSNYVVTWIYNDGNGNQSSQVQNITVWKDEFPPVALCKPITIDLSSALNGAASVVITAADVDNHSNDNGPMGCKDMVALSVSPSSFGCANLGANIVTLTVSDGAAPPNSATCTAVVTVRDVTSPVLVGVPANITVESCSVPSAIPPAAVVTSLDNCTAPVTLTEVSNQGTGCAQFNYTITRTWTATDGGLNVAQAAQIITVSDTKAPVFAANLADITVSTESNDTHCDAAVKLVAAATDACSATNTLTFTQTYSGPGRVLDVTCTTPSVINACASGVYNVGTHTVTFTVSDVCGNIATKTITIVVKDGTIPTAVCINGVSAALLSSGSVTVSTLQFDNHSFDNCAGPLDLEIQRTDLDTLQPPSMTLTFTCDEADGVTHWPVQLFVTDPAGNVSTCQTYIVIQDNNPATIVCPANASVVCTSSLSPAALGSASASDNCPLGADAISFADAYGPGTMGVCEVLTRTWSVRDGAGNLSHCDQVVNIIDNVPPTLSSEPSDITIPCTDALIAPDSLTGSDNCGSAVTVNLAIQTTQTTSGCGKYSYVETRTWTATDACGNVKVHTQVVTVTDLEAPEFNGVPSPFIVESASHPATTNCTVPVDFDIRDFIFECPGGLADVTVTSTIVPAVVGIGTGPDISGDYPVGDYTVTFVATDACGNMNTFVMPLKVVDNTTPNAVCIDLTASLNNTGEVSIDAQVIGANSTDNCGIASMTLSQSNFDCTNLGLNVVTLTVTDINGNTNSCESNVEVILGTTTGFTLAVTSTPETFFGAGDGTATAVATGGSGMFSFVWSTSDTTATITDLPAGTYTVSATDLSTGCISIQTVTVADGPKITVTVGNVDSCQGQIVIVPVTIDNFINVSGFSFGLQLTNGLVGTILNLSDVNPAITNAVITSNSIFWTSPGLTGVTLPSGSLLFNLSVQLSNAPTPVGTTSPVTPSALPTLAFLQNILNVPTPAGMIVFNNGSVTINCAANAIEVAGKLTTWKAPVQPIPGANVALTGTITGNVVTTLPLADYSFLVPGGANTVVTPTKVATGKSSKINVGDLLFIQAHAAPPPVQIPFTSPYQWLAGDINGDNIINIVDYALVQAYIVNNQQVDGHFHFNPAPPDWKFVPKSYVFPAPNPLIPTPPNSISNTNVLAAITGDDFVGVLLGDVNGDVIPNFNSNGGSDYNGTFKLRINERSIGSGETVTIPFRASDFTDRQAYQLTIAFDPSKFELSGIEPGVLPDLTDANFGTAMLNDGLISTLWVGTKPLTLSDNDVLFSLTFKALSNVNALSDVLHSSSDIAEAMAIDNNGNVEGVDFEFVSSVGTNAVESKSFALYQNQPNPFSTETTIGFRLPEAGRAKLHIFGMDGRLVKTIVGDYPAGNNAVTIRNDAFGAPGVYWYELETLQHSDRKKMILIN